MALGFFFFFFKEEGEGFKRISFIDIFNSPKLEEFGGGTRRRGFSFIIK